MSRARVTLLWLLVASACTPAGDHVRPAAVAKAPPPAPPDSQLLPPPPPFAGVDGLGQQGEPLALPLDLKQLPSVRELWRRAWGRHTWVVGEGERAIGLQWQEAGYELFAFAMADGRTHFRRKLGSHAIGLFELSPGAVAVIGSQSLEAFGSEDGATLWSFATAASEQMTSVGATQPCNPGACAAYALIESQAFPKQYTLIALDMQRGTQLYRVTVPAPKGQFQPAIAFADAERVLVRADEQLLVFGARDGAARGSWPQRGERATQVLDGTAYELTTGGDLQLYAVERPEQPVISVRAPKGLFAVMRTARGLLLCADETLSLIDAASGAVRWSRPWSAELAAAIEPFQLHMPNTFALRDAGVDGRFAVIYARLSEQVVALLVDLEHGAVGARLMDDGGAHNLDGSGLTLHNAGQTLIFDGAQGPRAIDWRMPMQARRAVLPIETDLEQAFAVSFADAKPEQWPVADDWLNRLARVDRDKAEAYGLQQLLQTFTADPTQELAERRVLVLLLLRRFFPQQAVDPLVAESLRWLTWLESFDPGRERRDGICKTRDHRMSPDCQQMAAVHYAVSVTYRVLSQTAQRAGVLGPFHRHVEQLADGLSIEPSRCKRPKSELEHALLAVLWFRYFYDDYPSQHFAPRIHCVQIRTPGGSSWFSPVRSDPYAHPQRRLPGDPRFDALTPQPMWQGAPTMYIGDSEIRYVVKKLGPDWRVVFGDARR